ncbi:unnamed protein product [Pleuronectes platessa]|uniref:Uncharacterized protein n=1 Tax=Pleuronectes platessa TaxID=8262 RepID=A0A9N7UID1_PLEPL|nr:unnamed protein product [Pleuronectes platessa]
MESDDTAGAFEVENLSPPEAPEGGINRVEDHDVASMFCLIYPHLAPTSIFCPGPETLSDMPEAQCAAPGGPHPVAPHGVTGAGAFSLLDRGAVSIAGAEGGPLEGTRYAASGGHSGRVSGPSRGSPQLRRPLGEPSVRAGRGGHLAVRLGWRLAAD